MYLAFFYFQPNTWNQALCAWGWILLYYSTFRGVCIGNQSLKHSYYYSIGLKILFLMIVLDPLLLLSHFSRVWLLRPHRWQPTKLPHPWDSPGKNTGVGCYFLLQCMKVKVKSLSRVRLLATPMDCSLPGSSIHGIFQARVLEWGATAFSDYWAYTWKKHNWKRCMYSSVHCSTIYNN